ncbi:MAG: hypothetical protein ACREC0_10760 [Methylocella sp.]
MPTIDGGHYFLTVLVPVKTDPIQDGSTFTSPVHALRKQLAMLPTAAQSPACGGGESPFARNTCNHFVRFSIIDDVAYNGRQQANGLVGLLWTAANKIDPMKAQPQDHLTCPFLFFGAEFDAANGADADRDTYLADLWDTMQKELKDIFTFCVCFDSSVNDAASFAKYIARGQIETTMSFNDYYLENPDGIIKILPTWPYDKILIPAGLGGIVLLMGLFIFIFVGWKMGFMVMSLGAVVLAAGLWLAYATLMRAGAKPFPPGADLPTVLKALHLQRAFTRFAINNQLLALDPASAPQLHAAFRDFLAENQPDNLVAPTQTPGVIGI